MLLKGAYQIARYAQIPREDPQRAVARLAEPCRHVYCNDEGEQPLHAAGSIAKVLHGTAPPRPGSDATTVLKGSAIVDVLRSARST